VVCCCLADESVVSCGKMIEVEGKGSGWCCI
jgi:hypothetical protein